MKMNSRLGAAIGGALALVFFLLGLNLPDGKAFFFSAAGFWGGLALAGLFFNRAPAPDSTLGKAPEPAVPASSPVADERDVFIPGRNFDEMLERLGSNESMLNVILNSMGEGVLLLNQADRVVLMNPSAEKILGSPEKDALGKHYLEVLRHPVLSDLLARAKAEGDLATGEIEFSSRDERTF